MKWERLLGIEIKDPLQTVRDGGTNEFDHYGHFRATLWILWLMFLYAVFNVLYALDQCWLAVRRLYEGIQRKD